MPKILVVDDHLDQREMIRFLLNKHAENWTVFEATNGKGAIDLFLTQDIDAIITDVKMPFVTGIEFAEIVRSKNSQIPLLFISGFEQFDFAKKAITLQAVNYILKPIRPSEFYEQLDKITQLLNEQKQVDQQERYIDQLIEKEALTKLLQSVPLTKLSSAEQEKLNNLVHKINYLIIVECHSTEEVYYSQALHLISSSSSFPIIDMSNGRYVLFTHSPSEIELEAKKQQIHKILTTNLPIATSVYLSKSFSKWEMIPIIYQQTSQTITQNFYDISTTIDLTMPLPTNNPLAEVNYFQQVTQFIQKNQYQHLFTFLTQTFQKFQDAAYESPAIVRFFFATLFKQLIETANIQQPNWQKTMTEILEVTFFSQLEPLFTPFYEIIKEREVFIRSSSNEYICEVKEYIFNHYQEELSLDNIAQEINITPKYLSELFIREEGIGLSKFIKSLRLSKAKELLKGTNKRITEISNETGFNNHSYFIKIFRETFQMTPDSYRKSKKR
jgi:two-component system response regulator YesN